MGRDHILLIGIDAYRGTEPLFGAANDVDAMERIFLDQLGISPDAVTKLVARHKGPRGDEQEPTLANIRLALKKLTGESVQAGDRVFIHYSGHGTRIEPRGGYSIREALVPMDMGGSGAVLFDYEMNDILRRIAARTEDVTVLLDCCFSAGVTRGAYPVGRVRTCRVEGVAPVVEEVVRAGMLSTLAPSDPGYVVVASAQSSEPVIEVSDRSGVWHGAFISALLDLLERKFVGQLGHLRWADVWPLLRAGISSRSPGQHPCLIGKSERRVFGGPYRRGDPGLTVVQDKDGYRIEAGSLAGLSEGAEIGVYGPEPAYFEPLGLPNDLRLRRGVLRVTSANLISAKAVPWGGAIALGLGDRGRLIKPGQADRLVVAMDPFDGTVARYLEQEAHVRVVAWGEEAVEAVVKRADDGRWWIGDDAFGADGPLGWANEGDLYALAQGLRHYARFNQPLRLARRSLDGGNRLVLTVLNAARVELLRPDELANPPLIEVNTDVSSGCRYRLVDGQKVCFSVWNHGSRKLYVQLFNCASSGTVQMLGTQQVEIMPGKRQMFWMRGHMGEPFRASVSPGREWNVDRLVAVGTVSPNVGLSCLEVTETFSTAMRSTHRGDEFKAGAGAEWEATCVKVRIVRG